MTAQDWFRSDDPGTLARRIEHVVTVLDRHARSLCAACDGAVCGHHVLFSLAAGHEDEPLCLPCLAVELGRPVAGVRDGLLKYVLSKECLRRGWRLAHAREGVSADSMPPCSWPLDGSGAAPSGGVAPPAPSPEPLHDARPDSTWDAGQLGCGELVLELRRRVERLAPGGVLLLRALDSGAPEDIPAWCRLTGHALVREEHPDYWIRRKD